jgi:catechol 2,3-dioxygenase-like lactoylglutathione lyase family enzyme
MSTNAARTWKAVRLSDEEAIAARTFYCDVLGGRQVWRVERADGEEGLFFIVNHALIETGPAFRDTRFRLPVDSRESTRLAERCWDAGFSVHVHEHHAGKLPLTLVDPFGRCIDLVPDLRLG